jgi:ribonuclease H2 subunit C
MSSTDKMLPQKNQRPSGGVAMPDDDPSADEDDGQPEEIRIVEEHAFFEEIIAWGYEALPDPSTDPYAKGMEEWIAFAEEVSR